MIEALEGRRLMSGNTVPVDFDAPVFVDKGRLTVRGGTRNDVVSITAMAGSGSTAGNISVTINGRTLSRPTPIRKVIVNLNAGNDTLTISAPTAAAAGLIRRLVVNLGDGNDTMTTTVRGSFFGGEGNDTITGSAGADSFVGGGGNDIIRSGGGADRNLPGPGVNFFFGSNNQDLAVDREGRRAESVRVRTGGIVELRGSNGADNVVLSTPTTGNTLSVRLNGQTTTIPGGSVGRLSVLLGGGDDTLDISSLDANRYSFSTPAIFDGENGSNTLIGTIGAFQGTTRNFNQQS